MWTWHSFSWNWSPSLTISAEDLRLSHIASIIFRRLQTCLRLGIPLKAREENKTHLYCSCTPIQHQIIQNVIPVMPMRRSILTGCLTVLVDSVDLLHLGCFTAKFFGSVLCWEWLHSSVGSFESRLSDVKTFRKGQELNVIKHCWQTLNQQIRAKRSGESQWRNITLAGNDKALLLTRCWKFKSHLQKYRMFLTK